MKRFHIHVLVDNTNEYVENFRKLLNALNFKEKTTYEVTIDISALGKIKPDVFLELVKIEQDYGKCHQAIFKNTLSCRYCQLNRRAIQSILRHGFEVVIQYEGIIEEKNKKLENKIKELHRKSIPYNLNINCATNEICSNFEILCKTSYYFQIENLIHTKIDLINEFDRWCLIENDCYSLKTFEDILCGTLLGYTHRDCKHSSCLGKRIGMKSNGDLYFCHSYDKISYLKNVSDVKVYSDIFESEQFGNLLLNSLKKRDKCSECERFLICQSGCPLLFDEKENKDCNEAKYCDLVQHIKNYLYEKLEIKHEIPQNPVIRKMILVSIAYKGKFEIRT